MGINRRRAEGDWGWSEGIWEQWRVVWTGGEESRRRQSVFRTGQSRRHSRRGSGRDGSTRQRDSNRGKTPVPISRNQIQFRSSQTRYAGSTAERISNAPDITITISHPRSSSRRPLQTSTRPQKSTRINRNNAGVLDHPTLMECGTRSGHFALRFELLCAPTSQSEESAEVVHCWWWMVDPSTFASLSYHLTYR